MAYEGWEDITDQYTKPAIPDEYAGWEDITDQRGAMVSESAPKPEGGMLSLDTFGFSGDEKADVGLSGPITGIPQEPIAEPPKRGMISKVGRGVLESLPGGLVAEDIARGVTSEYPGEYFLGPLRRFPGLVAKGALETNASLAQKASDVLGAEEAALSKLEDVTGMEYRS